MDAYKELAQYILPEVVYRSFDLVRVEKKTSEGGLEVLHLYVDEKPVAPDNRKDLRSNGFYGEMVMGDFPLRERKVILHVQQLLGESIQETRLHYKHQERIKEIDAMEEHKAMLMRRDRCRREMARDTPERRGRRRKRLNEAYRAGRLG